jgi:hypothetical protein
LIFSKGIFPTTKWIGGGRSYTPPLILSDKIGGSGWQRYNILM